MKYVKKQAPSPRTIIKAKRGIRRWRSAKYPTRKDMGQPRVKNARATYPPSFLSRSSSSKPNSAGGRVALGLGQMSVRSRSLLAVPSSPHLRRLLTDWEIEGSGPRIRRLSSLRRLQRLEGGGGEGRKLGGGGGRFVLEKSGSTATICVCSVFAHRNNATPSNAPWSLCFVRLTTPTGIKMRIQNGLLV